VKLLPLFLPLLAASLAAAPTGLLTELMEFPERTTITAAHPRLGWIYTPTRAGDRQSAYQIQLGTSAAVEPASWDSGRVASARSIGIEYAGAALAPNRSYYWRVRTWDAAGAASAWSSPQQFRTAAALSDAYTGTPRYPLELTGVAPVRMVQLQPGRYFFDFGQDAYAYVTLHLAGNHAGTKLDVRFGERANGDSVHTEPGAKIRYATTTITLADGERTYDIHPPALSGRGVAIPAEIGTVLPFRYFEIMNAPEPVTITAVSQRVLHYPFNDTAAAFRSSSDVLNRIWKLCQYSMKATSFAGVYVDGDRERLPYEADAYINQLGHYGVDREFTLARYSHEFLLARPTWPTEWKSHSILIAWADYMATADERSLKANYAALRRRLFLDRVRPADGLLRGYKAYPPPRNVDFPNSDIVDWPMTERDGYVFTEYNTVINAFWLRTLELMAEIADVVGKPEDAREYRAAYARGREAFNRVFWDAANARYTDGEGTAHASSHANFFPLAFRLVPDARKSSVVAFVKSRGMAPSVYGAQFLLEGLYEAGAEDAALELLTSTAERSWWNMIVLGSTITLEAWSHREKPNLDWNHAWGAAPANIIPRYLLGLKPLEPGYGRVEIHPRPGNLEFVEGTIPTIRGPVYIRVDGPRTKRRVQVVLPGNMTAKIIEP
jgi:hypothetical protein